MKKLVIWWLLAVLSVCAAYLGWVLYRRKNTDSKPVSVTSIAAVSSTEVVSVIPSVPMYYSSGTNEVVASEIDLVGAAPGGAKWGVNVVNKKMFMVDSSGQWQSITPDVLRGVVTFPALANAQSTIVSATIAGLSVGSLIVSSVENINSAYGGAPIPENVTILCKGVVDEDTLSFLIINETGVGIDSFTANIVVTKL